MKIVQSAIIIGLILCSANTYADQQDLNRLQEKTQDWYIVKQDNTRQITTYAKREDGQRVRSFKIDAVVDASLSTLASIHFDVANIKKWYWETTESRLINKVSETEYIYYMKFNAPLATDRDVVLKATITPYKQGGNDDFMLLSLRATPSALPVPTGVTRMNAFDVDIKFTPLVNGKTQMKVQGLIDPTGSLPAWTSNMFQRQAPYATMLGLYRMTQKAEYAKVKLPLAFKYAQ